MAIKQTNPTSAHERMRASTPAIYVDVRSEAEFERGHPEGAFNIPLVFPDPSGGPARPNPDFTKVVASLAGPDQELLLGCQTGGRSQRACELLDRAGYTNLANVQGGFGGAKDRAGQVIAKGWVDSELPVETGHPAGRAYAYLRHKAGAER